MRFPIQSLGFNPEIRHNDGLLANSLRKEENISYQTACLQIRSYVDFLNRQLAEEEMVHIQWVGNLSLSEERKIVFTPSSILSCNANYFGLYHFYVPSLKDLEAPLEHPFSEQKEKNEETIFIPINKWILRWTGSAAAVAAALFLVVTPVNEHLRKYSQEANVIPFSSKITKNFTANVETPTESVVPMNIIEGTNLDQTLPMLAQNLPIAAEKEKQKEQTKTENTERKGAEKKDAEKKDAEKKDAEKGKKEEDKKEANKKDKDADKKDSDNNDNNKKNADKKDKEGGKNTVKRQYYIVIASMPTSTLAEKALSDFQKSNFPTAQIISDENKHRIYVRQFEDKEEAEAFLIQFRADYPQHKDAWLLSHKGK